MKTQSVLRPGIVNAGNAGSRRVIGRAVLLLGALLIWAINQFSLLHLWAPDYTDIRVSRYMLGRWPREWDEVRRAARSYFGTDIGADHFLTVSLRPIPDDACEVTFRFRNIIGYPYTDRAVLHWSKALQGSIARDEIHTGVARIIAMDYRFWVQNYNGGKLNRDLNRLWKRLSSPKEFTYYDPPIRSANLVGRPTSVADALIEVQFGDGVVRRVPVMDHEIPP